MLRGHVERQRQASLFDMRSNGTIPHCRSAGAARLMAPTSTSTQPLSILTIVFPYFELFCGAKTKSLTFFYVLARTRSGHGPLRMEAPLQRQTACAKGHFAVVELLINHDSDLLDKPDGDGWTPLLQASICVCVCVGTLQYVVSC